MVRQGSVYLFMVLMLVTGALNTLLAKTQNMQVAPLTIGGPSGHFNHPFLQASFTTVGAFLCLPIYLATRDQSEVATSAKVPKWIFIVPCCCDFLAVTLMCAAFSFIAVSVAQICRGAVVVFTCVFSVAFLGRRQHTFHLVGVALVVLGITLVSSSAIMTVKIGDERTTMLGLALCVVAQIFQASMYVYEEMIMSQYAVQPLQVVGWEGLFGLFLGAGVLLLLHPLGYADTPGALHQIYASRPLAMAVIACVFSVALFDFTGATVTKRASAVARSTIKVSSTIIIWFVELYMGWNEFCFLQFLGFLCVACGTLVYNKVIVLPFLTPVEELTTLPWQSEKAKADAAL